MTVMRRAISIVSILMSFFREPAARLTRAHYRHLSEFYVGIYHRSAPARHSRRLTCNLSPSFRTNISMRSDLTAEEQHGERYNLRQAFSSVCVE